MFYFKCFLSSTCMSIIIDRSEFHFLGQWTALLCQLDPSEFGECWSTQQTHSSDNLDFGFCEISTFNEKILLSIPRSYHNPGRIDKHEATSSNAFAHSEFHLRVQVDDEKFLWSKHIHMAPYIVPCFALSFNWQHSIDTPNM